jgi:hypothetical protein
MSEHRPEEGTQEQELAEQLREEAKAETTNENLAEEATPSETAQEPESKPEQETIPKKAWDQLYRRLKDTERALDEVKTKKQEPISKPLDKPVYDNYDSDQEFMEAIADWKSEQRMQEYHRKQEEDSVRKSQSERDEQLQKKIMLAAAKDPNFETNAIIPMELKDLVIDSDQVIELGYYFAQQPAEMNKILDLSKKSPTAAARAIGAIEAKLASSSSKVIKTNAPATTSPVKTQAMPETDPYSYSTDKFIKWWNENVRGT